MPKKNSLEVFLEKNSTLLLLLSIVVIVLYLKYTREGFGKRPRGPRGPRGPIIKKKRSQ